MLEVTIGCDPELFAFSGELPVSVHDLLPGNKYHPCKVPRGAIQVDGVAAEFNIEPTTDKKIFIKNITHVKGIMEKLLKAKNSSLSLRAVPTVHFDAKYFSDLPTETKVLGCEPDYDVYSWKANPKPETDKPMRTGSGHVHIGWSIPKMDGSASSDPAYQEIVRNMVKELDFVLYRQSISWDKDEERMELYGRPGCFRFKPYGIEYRTLSNAWLASKELMAFVFDASKVVAERVLNNGKTLYNTFENSGELYERYLKRHNVPFVGDYYANA